jgi:hypothetical protein
VGDPGAGADQRDGADRGPPFALSSRVGRLIEVRLWRLRDADDLLALGAGIDHEARRLPTRALIFADHRRTSPIPPDVADSWCRCMRGHKESVVRSAILLEPSNDTYNLQVERVVRCALNPLRRVFYERQELRDWLGQAGTTEELARLDQLLAEEED